ncbi:MAG: RHS repeat-associated core domain-containing protein [Simkania sp.]|nr:RHS repeat-associated core domain-containing protein [Simkania sp.]
MWKKFLALFWLATNFAWGEAQNDPYEMAVFGGEPSSVIDGCINAITGDYFISEEDWVIPGLEPIVIRRKYLSRHCEEDFGGWELFFNHLKIQRVKVTDGCRLLQVPDKQGFHLWYVGSFYKRRFNYELHGDYPEALTNCYTGELNGRMNAFNQKVRQDPDNWDVILIDAADGTRRAYRLLDKKANTYYLLWESLPNTNRLHYHWEDVCEEKRLKKIVTTDAGGKRQYAAAVFDYVFGDKRHLYSITISDEKNGGRSIRYRVRCDNHEGKKYWNICQIDHPSRPDESFKYWTAPDSGLMVNGKEVGDGRQMRLVHYKEGWNGLIHGGVRLDRKDAALHRVKHLMRSLGENGEMRRAYELFYESGKYKKGPGATTVIDAKKNRIQYYYNKYFLLTEIRRCSDSNELLSREIYDWKPYDKKRGSWLQGKSLYDEKGRLVYSYGYEYDLEGHGNLVKESFSGDLTGNGLEEKYVIQRTFHENNLVYQEFFPNGKVFEYHYVPGTHLLAKKFVFDGSAIKIRHFYFYQGAALVKEVIDDGSTRDFLCLDGVTERRIKKIKLRNESPFLDFPEVIEECYVDLSSSQEKLLSQRAILKYDSMGHPVEEAFSDANGELPYTIEHEYDSKERLAARVDPMGNRRSFHYDANDNIVREEKEDEAFDVIRDYDLSNRLRQTSHVSSAGVQQVKFNYNDLHQKEEETDIYGNTTFHEYDAFGNPLISFFPEVENDQGQLETPCVERLYNVLGKVIWERDPEGYETQTETTSRGQPKKIKYADGTEEFFTYDLNGNIASHLSCGKTITAYEYDFLDRMISKKIFFEEDLLSEESFVYDAFHLLEHHHPDQAVTTYCYDGAGRKIQEKTADHVTEFAYDSFGRLSKIVNWCDSNTAQVLIKEYDLLDRLVLEKEEDQDGRLFKQIEYHYDSFGNLKETVFYHESLDVVQKISYDAFRRVIQEQDAEGNITSTSYNERFINHLGQRILQKITTDPKNRQTVETYTTHGKVARLEKISEAGLCALREEFFYDLNDRKVKQVSTLFQPDKIIVTSWRYDAKGRVVEHCEGVGTEYEKVTHYKYTSDGHLKTLSKPDDIVLSSTYDGLGRKQTLESSDGSIAYSFQYDAMGNMILATDALTCKVTKRDYDHFGNLLKETLANGQSLCKAYDRLNRPTLLTYADGSQTRYLYDAYHLLKIQRLEYTHEYSAYDMQHHVKQERLPSQLGVSEHSIDILGRRFKTTSPYSQEWISEFDPNGNVCLYRFTRYNNETSTRYSYDALDHLIEESGPVSHSFAYDSHHNRTVKNDSVYSLNLLHELESTTASNYEQDLNGNRIAKHTRYGKIQYNYDALDRLVEIITPAVRYVFSYDPLNRLIEQQTFSSYSSERKTYLYDDKNELGAFPHELRILGLGKGAEIGATIAIEKHNTVLIPMHDLFGNIIALIESKSGHVVEQQRFSAFGESKNPPKLIPWGYQSKRHLHDLIFFGRRFYDPDTGRFLSPDPKSFMDGPNLYQFLLNNPLLYVDLYGEHVGTRIWEAVCHPRVQGGLQFVGGATEAVIGGGMAYFSAGIAAPLGWVVMAHGLDHAITGFKTCVYGEFADTATTQLLEKAGMSHNLASSTDSVMSLGGSMGGIAALRMIARTSFPAFRLNNNFANELIQQNPPLKFQAENANASIWLRGKLSGLEKAQNIYSRVRFLPDGRIRYYTVEIKASKPGLTKCASYVTEWSVENGQVRSWMECYDHLDQTIRVHPKTVNGQILDSIHYPPIGNELGKMK